MPIKKLRPIKELTTILSNLTDCEYRKLFGWCGINCPESKNTKECKERKIQIGKKNE